MTLGFSIQACPKQQVYSTFAVAEGKREGWSWYFAADKLLRFLQIDI